MSAYRAREATTVIVCSCHRVCDRDVAAACASGASRLGQIARATRAGTSCGRCIPSLREIVDRAQRAGADDANTVTPSVGAVASLAS